jgi:hypothetical protein
MMKVSKKKYMQTQLPLFPQTTQLINPSVGVNMQDGFVYYLHNGSPLFCHKPEDRNGYRYITANMVESHLCTASEIARALGVSARSVQLNAKALRDKGPGWFFHRTETRGKCYKFTDDTILKAQELLDSGLSKREIGRQLGVSDSAIRYHLERGKLKKKRLH